MSVPQKRLLRTAIPGPRSTELHARRRSAVAGGVASTLAVYVEQAGGAILIDVDGNQLIDFGAGIAVTSVGHAAPGVVDAVINQVARFTHSCFMVTPYEGYVAVCEQLNELTPGTHAKRSVLFNSGAEAVENAVKIARYHTGRPVIVAFDHAYHGRTNLAMALTAKAMPYKHGFGPLAGDIVRVPMAYPYRWPTGPDRCADEAFEQLVTQVHTQVGEDQVAAVVVEPIQGEGGFVVPAPGFLVKVANWCAAHGILLIADEVQTGFCRTGDWFASEHEHIVPDLVATAKALAGGLPLAAVTGRADIMDEVHAGGLGGTFGGNPVSCAAALAAIDTMRADDLCGAARRIESVALPRLQTLAKAHDTIGDVRGRGAMLAIELVEPGTKTPDPVRTTQLARACHKQGLVTLTAGTFGNVLRLLPPLVIGDDLLLEGLDIIAAALDEVS